MRSVLLLGDEVHPELLTNVPALLTNALLDHANIH